jgi:hypothetical protein
MRMRRRGPQTHAVPLRVRPARPHLLSLALLPLLAGCGGGGGEYRPSSGLERLAGAVAGPGPTRVERGDASVELLDAGLIQDFDGTADRLYLLERWGRVLVLSRGADSRWTYSGAFGRRGTGPGEFEHPTGIAVVPAGVLVSEAHRLQLFSDVGTYLTGHPLALPCPMARPAVASAGSGGLFVHGNCMRSGYVTDTVSAVLAWSPDTSGFQVIAEEVRFTRDGSTGSIFGTASALGTGTTDRHVFGGGATNCVTAVSTTGGRPILDRRCPAAMALYSAPPPPDLERRLRAGMPGIRANWPATLPPYVERIVVGDDIVLVRPFSADSVVLQTAAPDSRDLAVAPLDGLVGCRAGGCLWVFEDQRAPRAWFLDADRLRALLDAPDPGRQAGTR